jgi:hypothetical protein
MNTQHTTIFEFHETYTDNQLVNIGYGGYCMTFRAEKREEGAYRCHVGE